MKKKTPPIPPERSETLRRKIVEILTGRYLSAGEISQMAGISEKDVYLHLEHVQKTVTSKNAVFAIQPASCGKCGFQFRARTRLKKPGKCPICRSSHIEEPLFGIQSRM